MSSGLRKAEGRLCIPESAPVSWYLVISLFIRRRDSRASPLGILPLGSDFPIEGVNPLLGFYAVVARLSAEGNSPHGQGGWYVLFGQTSSVLNHSGFNRYSEQRLTRAQALKGMTLDAAYASFAENELGSLTPGKKGRSASWISYEASTHPLAADFVVLDRDIMTIPFSEILGTKVLATVVDGLVAYGTL